MARAAGANVPESIKINSNLAVRRRIGLEQIVFKTGKKRIGYSRQGCKFGAPLSACEMAVFRQLDANRYNPPP